MKKWMAVLVGGLVTTVVGLLAFGFVIPMIVVACAMQFLGGCGDTAAGAWSSIASTGYELGKAVADGTVVTIKPRDNGHLSAPTSGTITAATPTSLTLTASDGSTLTFQRLRSIGVKQGDTVTAGQALGNADSGGAELAATKDGAPTSVTALLASHEAPLDGQPPHAVSRAVWAVPGNDAESDHIGRRIDQVAQQLHLPGKATLLALMAGLDESGLHNLDHGDLDSQGVFQQRPSQGYTDVRNVDAAAAAFFLGPNRDGRGGLVSVPDWETMNPNDAIQAVQRSGTPDAYAKFEQPARQLAAKLNIQLDRDGQASGNAGIHSNCRNAHIPASGSTPGGIPTPPGSRPAPLGDGPCPLDRPGQAASCNEALNFAAAEAATHHQAWHNLCLHLVTVSYGGAFPYPTARDAAFAVEAAGTMHHDASAIPRGAVLWWWPGNPSGHVTLYAGDGMSYSTDAPTSGEVGYVPWDYPSTAWGQTFMGWSAPFPTSAAA